MKDGPKRNGITKTNHIGGHLLVERLDKARMRSGGVQCRNANGKISAEIDAVGTIVKERTNTLNESCRESAKRESEFYKMVEQEAVDERQELKERSILKDLLQQLQKEREEEEEARGFIEEMQCILDEAQASPSETERKLGRVLGEYINSIHHARTRCGR